MAEACCGRAQVQLLRRQLDVVAAAAAATAAAVEAARHSCILAMCKGNQNILSKLVSALSAYTNSRAALQLQPLNGLGLSSQRLMSAEAPICTTVLHLRLQAQRGGWQCVVATLASAAATTLQGALCVCVLQRQREVLTCQGKA